MNFNGIFRKNVAYDNMKNRQKLDPYSLSLENAV